MLLIVVRVEKGVLGVGWGDVDPYEPALRNDGGSSDVLLAPFVLASGDPSYELLRECVGGRSDDPLSTDPVGLPARIPDGRSRSSSLIDEDDPFVPREGKVRKPAPVSLRAFASGSCSSTRPPAATNSATSSG